MNYYQQQFAKLSNKGVITVKFYDDMGNTTNCMTLTPDQYNLIKHTMITDEDANLAAMAEQANTNTELQEMIDWATKELGD